MEQLTQMKLIWKKYNINIKKSVKQECYKITAPLEGKAILACLTSFYKMAETRLSLKEENLKCN